MNELYDVVAVDLSSKTVRLIAEDETLCNAEAVVCMAVMRRGVETEFFVEVRAGLYHKGDAWAGREKKL